MSNSAKNSASKAEQRLLPGDLGAGNTKQCPVCGETIWVHALKCTRCSSDLTWRRYLTFSNTTLALITALISVIAASAPALRLLVTLDNSVLSAVFAGISTSGETVSMLFSNRGRRTGAISRVWISVVYREQNEIRLFSIYPHTKDDGAIYVEPGKTLGAEFFFSNSQVHWRPKNAAAEDLQKLVSGFFILRDAECTISAAGINADGSPFDTKLKFDCTNQAFQMFRKILNNAKVIKNEN
jgi:hypothetical protein